MTKQTTVIALLLWQRQQTRRFVYEGNQFVIEASLTIRMW